MKDLTIDQLVVKWKPILDTMNIDLNYYEKIASFCEDYYQEGRNSNSSFNDFTITLRILSKLNLDKVEFTKKNICKEYKIIMKLPQSYYNDIINKTGIDVVMITESTLITQFIQHINEVIDEEGGIVINGLIRIISNDKNMELLGSLISLDVYRLRKLKKIRGIINEREH